MFLVHATEFEGINYNVYPSAPGAWSSYHSPVGEIPGVRCHSFGKRLLEFYIPSPAYTYKTFLSSVVYDRDQRFVLDIFRLPVKYRGFPGSLPSCFHVPLHYVLIGYPI